jgi:hypothetical protein
MRALAASIQTLEGDEASAMLVSAHRRMIAKQEASPCAEQPQRIRLVSERLPAALLPIPPQ